MQILYLYHNRSKEPNHLPMPNPAWHCSGTHPAIPSVFVPNKTVSCTKFPGSGQRHYFSHSCLWNNFIGLRNSQKPWEQEVLLWKSGRIFWGKGKEAAALKKKMLATLLMLLRRQRERDSFRNKPVWGL